MLFVSNAWLYYDSPLRILTTVLITSLEQFGSNVDFRPPEHGEQHERDLAKIPGRSKQGKNALAQDKFRKTAAEGSDELRRKPARQGAGTAVGNAEQEGEGSQSVPEPSLPDSGNSRNPDIAMMDGSQLLALPDETPEERYLRERIEDFLANGDGIDIR